MWLQDTESELQFGFPLAVLYTIAGFEQENCRTELPDGCIVPFVAFLSYDVRGFLEQNH
jgi:hypothetical protein